MPEDAPRYNNLAAVAVLAAPDWATPDMRQWAAAHPRPAAEPYYSLYVPDSDEEWEPAGSDVSGMTDVQRPTASVGSDAGTCGAQEQQQEQQGATADSIDAAAAAAVTAAEEEASADTAVPAPAGEGALPPIRVRVPAAASRKENAEHNSPGRHSKRSRKGGAVEGDAAAE